VALVLEVMQPVVSIPLSRTRAPRENEILMRLREKGVA